MDDYKELCELTLSIIKMQVPATNNPDDMENLTIVKISDMSDEQIKWVLQKNFKDDRTYDSRVKSLIALVKYLNQFIKDPSNTTTLGDQLTPR